MVRRVYTYPANMGLETMNLVASLGAVLMVAAVAVFLFNALWSRKRGEIAGMNPWGASGLEWGVPSPPPIYNFVEPPTVAGRDALWDAYPGQPIITGLSVDSREVLSTKVVDADPDHIEEMPEPSIWPFLSSVAVAFLFVGSIFNPWAMVWFTPLVALTMTIWFWPSKKEVDRRRAKERYATNS
jgi:heme/copper-type cytochrome/quinol oxidase subunit 1